MISKYKLGIALTLIVNLCFSDLLNSQSLAGDTVKRAEPVTYIAYGEKPSWAITSAISTIRMDKLVNNFDSNLPNRLAGRLAGLTVVQGSGEPGDNSPDLYLRGVSTFGDGNYKTRKTALVIVDGFESKFEYLTPEEIESFSILKDAAATAMYGGQAANGVILITTKRGYDGPLKVELSTQYGFQSPTELPKFLGSYDYARLFNQALINDGKAAVYSDASLEAYRTGSDPYLHPDVNWYDVLLRKQVPVSNINLNFRGGNEVVKYFVALNSLTNQGVLINAKDQSEQFGLNPRYSKYNFRSNVEMKVSKSTIASINIGGAVEDKKNPGNYTSQSIFDRIAKLPPNSFPVYNPNGTFSGTTAKSNPLGDLLQAGNYSTNTRNVQATIKVEQKLDFLTKGLSVSGAVSFSSYFKSYSKKTRTYTQYTLGAGTNPGTYTYTPFGLPSNLGSTDNRSDNWQSMAFLGSLNYNRVFGANTLDVTLTAKTDDLSYSIDNDDTNKNFKNNDLFSYIHNSYGGRFTYTNNKKYIAEFTFGYSGTDNFADGKKYGFFPAGSLGWIVTNENFLSNNASVNFLKIRGSYGFTGNDDIGGTRYMFQQYFAGTGVNFGKTSDISYPGTYQDRIMNPNVTWEKQKTINMGFEAVLFKQLEISFDYFKNNRSDILSEPNSQVPSYLGITLPLLNIGKVENKGIEAIVGFTSVEKNGFQYFFETNFSFARNKLIDKGEEVQLYDYLYRKGHPVNQPFGLVAIGFFKDQEDINNSPIQALSLNVQPGDIKYQDLNNDSIINAKDVTAIGKTSVPEFTFGFHTGLKYKGFDFEVFVQGVTGCSVSLGSYYKAFQGKNQVAPNALGAWVSPNEPASYPRLSSTDNENNYLTSGSISTSTFWQRNASFIKLRSAELGYTFKGGLLNKAKIENARVFVNGTNLLSIDDIEEGDPEALEGYPVMRTISIGAKLQF